MRLRQLRPSALLDCVAAREKSTPVSAVPAALMAGVAGLVAGESGATASGSTSKSIDRTARCQLHDRS
jgi:hypothetical protein